MPSVAGNGAGTAVRRSGRTNVFCLMGLTGLSVEEEEEENNDLTTEGDEDVGIARV